MNKRLNFYSDNMVFKSEKVDLKKIAVWYIYSFCIALVIIYIFFSFFYLTSKVYKTSMQPTLNADGIAGHNDIVYINRFCEIQRGDVIVINSNVWLVKRVVAIGGDKINFKTNDYGCYEFYLNGEIQYENYILKHNNLANYNGLTKYASETGEPINPLANLYYSSNYFECFEDTINPGFELPDFVIREKEMFVMGDNRLVSIDSRDEIYGTFSLASVIGRVDFIKDYKTTPFVFFLKQIFK